MSALLPTQFLQSKPGERRSEGRMFSSLRLYPPLWYEECVCAVWLIKNNYTLRGLRVLATNQISIDERDLFAIEKVQR